MENQWNQPKILFKIGDQYNQPKKMTTIYTEHVQKQINNLNKLLKYIKKTYILSILPKQANKKYNPIDYQKIWPR